MPWPVVVAAFLVMLIVLGPLVLATAIPESKALRAIFGGLNYFVYVGIGLYLVYRWEQYAMRQHLERNKK